MRTFNELKALFAQDLFELRQLEKRWSTKIEERHVKEQEIGRRCYEAEEDLSPLDLNVLKRQLGVSDAKWREYKARFIEGGSPWGLI